MSIKIHSTDGGFIPPWKWMAAAAGTYKIGDALIISSGKLTAVTSGSGQSDSTPHYVCMADITAGAGDLIPVVKTDAGITWETQLQADSASLAVGLAYTLHTDGRTITTTTSNGCFTVTGYDGKTAGDAVRGILV